MKRSRGMITTGRRHGRVVRAVAVFFVLFTVADITLPQYFCAGEEIGGLPLYTTYTHELTSLGTETGTEAPSPGRDSEAPHDEDCFCCCAGCVAATAPEL